MNSVSKKDVSDIYAEIIAEKYETFKRVLEDFDIGVILTDSIEVVE